jgi:pentose-5-phosphate-3-epimerase
MTYKPDSMLKEYKEAGTDQITFHYESVEKDMIVPIIEKIKSLGMKQSRNEQKFL